MLNLQVINRSKTAKEIYKEQKDTYHYLIALVNLSDGYLGAGLIKEAEIEGRRVYEESKPLPWKHVHNIAAICYGNILTQQGKTSSSSLLRRRNKNFKRTWISMGYFVWPNMAMFGPSRLQ